MAALLELGFYLFSEGPLWSQHSSFHFKTWDRIAILGRWLIFFPTFKDKVFLQSIQLNSLSAYLLNHIFELEVYWNRS